jgi:hypothetical protein
MVVFCATLDVTEGKNLEALELYDDNVETQIDMGMGQHISV